MFKFFLLVLMVPILIVGVALLGAVFVWFGWNHGVVPAFSFAREVSLFQAFCLSLMLSSVGSMFKSTLTVNSKD
jgi:hypothetical protein